MDEGDFVYLGKKHKGDFVHLYKMSKENSVRGEGGGGDLSVSRLTPIYDIGSR